MPTLALPWPPVSRTERMIAMVDKKALGRLLASKQMLTRQQYKTIKGQILAGDAEGAMRGLEKIKAQKEDKKC